MEGNQHSSEMLPLERLGSGARGSEDAVLSGEHRGKGYFLISGRFLPSASTEPEVCPSLTLKFQA